jgi:release factor glutamine methyltransferase
MSADTSVRRALAVSGLVPLDAQVLLAHVLQRDRAWLIAHADDALRREQRDAFAALARRRRDGEPVAYLTGVREFWGLPFLVSPAVLIPRPETETLVELALARLPDDRDVGVLDLGTGSGAIAIAIARARPRARVLATDVSVDALALARENARRLCVANVEFLHSDWYENVPRDGSGAPFALIASNPPYVAGQDPHLLEGDVRFEPARALSPGGDGLAAIRTIVGGARERLAPGGTLVVEHGYDQAERVRELFAAAGLAEIVAVRDLAGIPRVVAGCRPFA